MRGGRPVPLIVGLVAGLAAAGCATTTGLEGGVFHSPKGYRIASPGSDWATVDERRADLELRPRGEEARLLAHATCDPAVAARPPGILTRHLLASARDRVVLERDEVMVGSRPAAHTLLEVPGPGSGTPIRVETYTVRGPRCVYDLVYAAPGGGFDRRRPDFQRFVASFGTE